MEADLPAGCLSRPSQSCPRSSLSLPTLKVEDMAWTVRQDCFVLADSSSRQRPRLPFVPSHLLDGGTRGRSGKASFPFPFSRALCLAGGGSELEELTLPPGAFSLICLALISKARGSGRGPGSGRRGLSQVVLGLFTAQAGQVRGESGRGCGSAAGPAALPFVSWEPRSRPLPSLGAGCAGLSHAPFSVLLQPLGGFIVTMASSHPSGR